MKRTIIALAIVIASLTPSAPVQARTCPAGYPVSIAHGCRSVAGNGVACDAGYQGQFRRTPSGWRGSCVVLKVG